MQYAMILATTALAVAATVAATTALAVATAAEQQNNGN
jgi:hypothetical protein